MRVLKKCHACGRMVCRGAPVCAPLPSSCEAHLARLDDIRRRIWLNVARETLSKSPECQDNNRYGRIWVRLFILLCVFDVSVSCRSSTYRPRDGTLFSPRWFATTVFN